MKLIKSPMCSYSLCMIVLLWSVNCNSFSQNNVYYISTDGNDSNPGTFTKPLKTWQKGIDKAQAGDTVYIRGGIYKPLKTNGNLVYLNGISGTPEKKIYIFNFPNEIPVLDGSGINFDGFLNGFKLNNSDYIHVKGLTIRSIAQSVGSSSKGIAIQNGSDFNIIENCDVSYIGGPGIIIDDNEQKTCHNNVILNSDSHHNSDPYSDEAYGNSDGFTISAGKTNDHKNILKKCRAWMNSDDGFDNWNDQGTIIYDSCVSFCNGYIPGTKNEGGDGAGFKLGKNEVPGDTIRWLRNCISFDNRSYGFTSNDADTTGISVLYNCSAYNNGNYGFTFLNATHIIINCLAHNNSVHIDPFVIQKTNSWNYNNLHSKQRDIRTIADPLLKSPEEIKNELCSIYDFGLDSTSELIDKGTKVGISYYGSHPDVGAVEYWPFTFIQEITLSSLNASNIINYSYESLQIHANILPNYATNKSLSWSIINGSGLATINQNGLVTPLANGTVKAVAFANDGSNVSDSLSLLIKYTSNPEIEEGEYLKIYPNPNRGVFKIRIKSNSNELKIYIKDITGRLIYSNSYNNKNEIIQEVELSSPNKGTYLLIIREQNKITCESFIII